MNTYLDLSGQGQNKWWRYVLAVSLILFMWQIIGAIPYVSIYIWEIAGGQLQTVARTGSLPGVDPTISFVALMLASVSFVLGIYLAVRFIHNRPFRTLITPTKSFDWVRFFWGFGTWFVLTGLMSMLEALLYPGRYTWTFDLKQFLPFALLALIFIPIQTSGEELFFRAYILQGIGYRLRNIWILCSISGFLFMLPHLLNPEASANYPLMGLYYFSMGAFLAYVTLRDGRLELALGVHAANNLFSVLIANYLVSVLPSPSLFTVNVLDAVYSVPAALVGMGIFIWLFVGPLRRRKEEENLSA